MLGLDGPLNKMRKTIEHPVRATGAHGIRTPKANGGLPMPTGSADSFNIDAELEALKQRKAKLKRLIQLREEIGTLEKGAMTGTGAKWAMNIIAEEVCAKFNLSFEMLTANSREESVCTPRRVAFYLGRELKQIPYAQIGRIFHKEHGTVLHGFRHIRERIETDKQFAAVVIKLKTICAEKMENSVNK